MLFVCCKSGLMMFFKLVTILSNVLKEDDMINVVFRITFLTSVFICTSFLFADTSFAQDGECMGRVTKVAEGGGDTRFLFTVTEGGMVIGEDELRDGYHTGGGVEVGLPVRVVETPTEGWVLSEINCDLAEGMQVEEIENGIIFNCLSPTEEISNCTFVNIPVSETARIPTLSEWGMIAAAAGLGLIGLFYAVRRRRAVRA